MANSLQTSESNEKLCRNLNDNLTTDTGSKSKADDAERSVYGPELDSFLATAVSMSSVSSATHVSEYSMRSESDTLQSPEVTDLECLLLADSTIDCAPLHLRQLLQHFKAGALTQAEILLLLIYCVALESGFATKAESDVCSDRIVRLAPTSSFHSKNILVLTGLPPTFRAADHKSYFSMQLRNLVRTPSKAKPTLLNALLTCLVTGDYLIVTLTPTRSSIPGHSLCISIARYVLSAKSMGKPLYQRFRKLAELSSLLRENLFMPVRNRQLDALEINVYPSLLGLPTELYEDLFQYLSKNQMRILANVCRHLNNLSTHSMHLKKK